MQWWQWRKQVARHEAAVERLETWHLQNMNAQAQEAGLDVLRRAVERMVRRDIGARLGVWCRASQDARIEAQRHAAAMHMVAEMDAMRLEAEAAAEGGRRGTALRQVRQLVCRCIISQVVVVLHAWHRSVRIDTHHSRCAKLKSEMRLLLRNWALRQLRQVLVSMSNGELVMAMAVWRSSAMSSAKHAAVAHVVREMHRVRLQAATAAVNIGRGSALSHLRQVAHRMMRASVARGLPRRVAHSQPRWMPVEAWCRRAATAAATATRSRACLGAAME